MDSNDIQRNYNENNGLVTYSNDQITNENSTIYQNNSASKLDHELSSEISSMASLTNNQRDLEKLFSHANEVKGDLETVINALVGIIGNNRKDQTKNNDLRNLIKETVISNYKQESNMLNGSKSSDLINQNWYNMQQSSSTNGPTVNVENVLKTIRANKLYYEQNQNKSERVISSKEKHDCSKVMKETYFRSLLSDPGHLDRQKPIMRGKLDSRRKQKNKYTNFNSTLENYFSEDRKIKRSKSVRSSCEMSSDFSQLGMVSTLHETDGNDEVIDPQYHSNIQNAHNNNNNNNNNNNARRMFNNQKLTNSIKNNSISNIQVTNNVGGINQDYYNVACNSNKSSPTTGNGINSSPGGNNSPSAWRMNGAGYHSSRFNYDPASSDCGSSSTGGHLMYNSYSTRSSHHQSNQHQYNQYKQRSHLKNPDYGNSTNNNHSYNNGMGTILPVASNGVQQPLFIDESSCSSLSNMSTVSSSAYHFQNGSHLINQQHQQNLPDFINTNQYATTPINNPHHLSTGSQLSASESNSGMTEHNKGLNDPNGNLNNNKSSCFNSSCFDRQANSISVSDSEGSAEPVRAIPVKKIPKLPSLGTQLPSKQGSYELALINQPEQHHRARYMTEGSRGAVKDRTGSGYPTVQLIGWSRPATLQVFVATEDGRTKAHNFYQACKVSGKQILSCKERMFDCTGLIEIQLEAKENQIIVLDCIGILKLRNVDVERRAGIQRIKQKSTMARLVFRVNLPHGDGFYTCLQVVSEPILCTQPIGSPEISKMSLYEGSCKGQMEMFIIGKNIVKSSQVLFQDYSEHKGIVWQADAKIDVEYLHQTHLVCTVPQYADPNLKTPVTVQVVLNCNGRLSEPRYFTYLPDIGDKSTYQHQAFNHPCHSNLTMQQDKADKTDWQYKENDNNVSVNYSTSTNCNENSALYHIMTNTNGANYNSDSSAIYNTKFTSNKTPINSNNHIQSNSSYHHVNSHPVVTLESTPHSSVVSTSGITNSMSNYHQTTVGSSTSTAHLNYSTDTSTQQQQSKLMQMHKYESLDQLPPYNNDGLLPNPEMDWTQSSTSTLHNDTTINEIHNSSYINSDNDGIPVTSANISGCYEGYPNSLESNIHSNLSADYPANTYVNLTGPLHKTSHHLTLSSKHISDSSQSNNHSTKSGITSNADIDISQCMDIVDASSTNNMTTGLPTIEEQHQLVQQRSHQILTNL